MVRKTAAERKAAERVRKVKGGLVRFEAWVTPDELWKLFGLYQRLRNKRKPSNQ